VVEALAWQDADRNLVAGVLEAITALARRYGEVTEHDES
jgi:hypothetical protein